MKSENQFLFELSVVYVINFFFFLSINYCCALTVVVCDHCDIYPHFCLEKGGVDKHLLSPALTSSLHPSVSLPCIKK